MRYFFLLALILFSRLASASLENCRFLLESHYLIDDKFLTQVYVIDGPNGKIPMLELAADKSRIQVPASDYFDQDWEPKVFQRVVKEITENANLYTDKWKSRGFLSARQENREIFVRIGSDKLWGPYKVLGVFQRTNGSVVILKEGERISWLYLDGGTMAQAVSPEDARSDVERQRESGPHH